MNFQQIIMRLNGFWADQGCVIWQPHNVQVGAGTANPATVLRVLGPEPWNAAYPEPSGRPADGRYGQNPNRWYEYFQYQVILKPDPGNHMDLYLQSLEALGIDRQRHDIRFVEDNWQSPSLAAWGLGWEVWLDGLEISQYTYFQQACGIDLDPVAVEITYGLERIAMFLQGVPSISRIEWRGDLSYGDLHLPEEIDYCAYNFEDADTARLTEMYELYEAEARNAVEHGLVLPAHDYVLRCSHVFNVLDARGAVGVTQRAHFFARMRDLVRQVAAAYLLQREKLGFPLLQRSAARIPRLQPRRRHAVATSAEGPADLLLEIGVEELPAGDLRLALTQLRELVPQQLSSTRLSYRKLWIAGTPRRLAVYVEALSPRGQDVERVTKGPPVAVAFDAQGQPTRAAEGFARSVGQRPDQLQLRDVDGRPYLTAVTRDEGRPALALLQETLPTLIAGLKFPRSMRWNETQTAFSRPIRWLAALYGDALVDVSYAGVPSDRVTYGARPDSSPELVLARAEDYPVLLSRQGIVVDVDERRSLVSGQVATLAAELGGTVEEDADLLDEVTNLVEQPVAIRGSIDSGFLSLPPEVLITVMKKHQRYFPLVKEGALLPAFVTVANGGRAHADTIRAGNEAVLRARFSDARFFYDADNRQPLSGYVPKLAGLVVQERLGTYLDKTQRLRSLTASLSERLNLNAEDSAVAVRAAELAKADLATNMVVEFTDLQGVMGSYYAERSGEEPRVATAIREHYLPRHAGDALPANWPGAVVGLADRLDNLVGFFAAGMAPTGTADPYGLRRAALGAIQILVDRQTALSVHDAIALTASLLPLPVTDDVRREVAGFVERRLQGWLLDQGYRHDLVAAVLAERGDVPAQALASVRSLEAWVKRPEFEGLLRAYARAARIVRPYQERYTLVVEYLTEPAAQRLYRAVEAVQGRIAADGSLDGVLTQLATLTEPVDAFFKDILVMADDPALRNARLGLLQGIAALPKGVVDLSKVTGF